ncbi:MAG TPA: hypothetical protein VFS47_08860 [Steroidobacteraceae bacterium]|nr:hypothetical protein [Steroidobacteraceae bacterium]
MIAKNVHRLEGLEPDNLLAFLALLGLLRSLDAADNCVSDAQSRLRARVSWDTDGSPLRPCLHLSTAVSQEDISRHVARGVATLVTAYQFNGYTKLKLTPEQARDQLINVSKEKDVECAALWAALISDAAAKDKSVERTPFCLLDVAQTSFLKTLASVVRASDRRQEAIEKALFQSWRWSDETRSFRWDPIEDTRHAYRAFAPSDDKQKVERGANILAAIALPVLTVVPRQHGASVRLHVVGGDRRKEVFVFAWPIWKPPASLAAIRAMLTHENLWKVDGLGHLGVQQVMVTRRIAPSRYNNFTRALPLEKG